MATTVERISERVKLTEAQSSVTLANERGSARWKKWLGYGIAGVVLGLGILSIAPLAISSAKAGLGKVLI